MVDSARSLSHLHETLPGPSFGFLNLSFAVETRRPSQADSPVIPTLGIVFVKSLYVLEVMIWSCGDRHVIQ